MDSTVETQKALRVKVAELCGWEFPTTLPACKAECLGFRPGAEECETIPDYPNDLNACAQFEETLTDEQWLIYLREICKQGNVTWRISIAAVAMPIVTMRNAMSATATRRCLAYVATMEASKAESVL